MSVFKNVQINRAPGISVFGASAPHPSILPPLICMNIEVWATIEEAEALAAALRDAADVERAV